jgi:hypothetical protein
MPKPHRGLNKNAKAIGSNKHNRSLTFLPSESQNSIQCTVTTNSEKLKKGENTLNTPKLSHFWYIFFQVPHLWYLDCQTLKCDT